MFYFFQECYGFMDKTEWENVEFFCVECHGQTQSAICQDYILLERDASTREVWFTQFTHQSDFLTKTFLLVSEISLFSPNTLLLLQLHRQITYSE